MGRRIFAPCRRIEDPVVVKKRTRGSVAYLVPVRKPHSARRPAAKAPGFVVPNRRIAADTPLCDASPSAFSLGRHTKAGFRTGTTYCIVGTEGFQEGLIPIVLLPRRATIDVLLPDNHLHRKSATAQEIQTDQVPHAGERKFPEGAERSIGAVCLYYFTRAQGICFSWSAALRWTQTRQALRAGRHQK